MMPICGFKTRLGRRCDKVADRLIGSIVLPDQDVNGEPWQQAHYLCHEHQNKLLQLLGFRR